MRPDKYIQSSDFASLANDSESTTITINIPSGVAVPTFPSTLQYSATAEVGSIGAPMNYDINYSTTTRRYKTTELQFVENSTGTVYQGLVKVLRTSSTEVSVYVVMGKGGGAVNTNARTVTVKIRTYIPPFA